MPTRTQTLIYYSFSGTFPFAGADCAALTRGVLGHLRF